MYKRLRAAKKHTVPERLDYGTDKEQYFFYYESENVLSNKVIFWVHGGGWNAGDPNFFDFVGQHISKAGYRMISAGYRLSPMSKNHIPMLLIQSKHDGLIQYECAEEFASRAEELGNKCELYSVEDRKNTHSWYTAGLFLASKIINSWQNRTGYDQMTFFRSSAFTLNTYVVLLSNELSFFTRRS